MKRYVGAIDQGTTSTRFLVFDRRGDVIAQAQREHRQICPRPGWVEHDPREIWTATEGVIRDALAGAGLTRKNLAAIGLTNQRETPLVWSRCTTPSSGWTRASTFRSPRFPVTTARISFATRRGCRWRLISTG